MLLHQLLASFQVFLFQRIRLPEKLLSHRLHADQLPSPAIFRDVGSERRVCCGDGVDRAALRAAEEGMLNIAISHALRFDGLCHSTAVVTIDFH